METDEVAKILIVDDQPKNIQVLAHMLDMEGYKIEYCTSGQDAINWVKNVNFDLILLDIMMPEMDGFQTCLEIRELEQSKDTPIVFLTAKTEHDSIVKAFQSGGTDYVTKPFNQDELLARVRAHLKLQSARKTIDDLYRSTMESIRYARQIQQSVLPSVNQLKKLLPHNFLFFQQRDIVGGDFYWIKELNDKIYLVIGDCTGHGVPGAMMSILGISVINNTISALPECNASLYLSIISEQIKKATTVDTGYNNDSIEFGLCIIDRKKRHIEYASHNFQLLRSSDSTKVKPVKLDNNAYKYQVESINGFTYEYLKSLSGLNSNEKSDKLFDVGFSYEDDDRIYMFSDGITDQFGGPNNKKLSRKGILNFIAQSRDLPIVKQGEEVQKSFINWTNTNKQVDDIIIMGFSLNFNEDN